MSRATALRASPTAASGRIAGLSDMGEVWFGPTRRILPLSAARKSPAAGFPWQGGLATYRPRAGSVLRSPLAVVTPVERSETKGRTTPPRKRGPRRNDHRGVE